MAGTFDLGNLNVGSAVNQVTNSLLQGALGKPLNSINDFINKVSSVTSVARAQGRSLSNESVIDAMRGRPDPSLSCDWIGMVLDPAVSIGSQLPWQYIDAITTPAISISTDEMFMNGRVRKFAAKYDVQTAEVKIYSDVNGLGYNFANNWARSSYRQDAYWNLPKVYKKDIQIFILDSTRSIVVDFRLIGCQVTSWNSYALDANDSVLETSLSLSVDDCLMNFDSDFTAAKSSLNSLLTSGLNSEIASLTSSIGGKVTSAITSLFGTDSGFNVI